MARQGVPYHTMHAMMVADSETMVETPRDGETIGELMLRGNTVMRGYLKNPDATEEAFRGGWFHTGDLAVRHPDGYVEMKDRAKDIIISGGENISSLEVEECLFRHPKIMEAAVVARPDDHWGETVCAFVTPRDGVGDLSEAEVAAWCHDRSRATRHRALWCSGRCRRRRRGKSRSSCCATARNHYRYREPRAATLTRSAGENPPPTPLADPTLLADCGAKPSAASFTEPRARPVDDAAHPPSRRAQPAFFRKRALQPASAAASILPMSIFCIVIIAANARLALLRSASVVSSISRLGVICHETPNDPCTSRSHSPCRHCRQWRPNSGRSLPGSRSAPSS